MAAAGGGEGKGERAGSRRRAKSRRNVLVLLLGQQTARIMQRHVKSCLLLVQEENEKEREREEIERQERQG